MSIQITSEGFQTDAAIPSRFTADGENVSPALHWSGLPPDTKELALIVDDPDAPRAEPFVHWVLYKIPGDAGHLPENVPHKSQLATPLGALQGRSSFGEIGYGGPAPPKGHGTHHYRFHLYALDQPLEVRAGLEKAALLAAMAGHILDEGELVGTYAR